MDVNYPTFDTLQRIAAEEEDERKLLNTMLPIKRGITHAYPCGFVKAADRCDYATTAPPSR